MSLDRIIMDPIICTENSTFTPLRSRPPIEHLSLPTAVILPSERDPLVGSRKEKKPLYRARPLWLVPFVLIASVTRGMTLASRVEVFTELSCKQFDINHTFITDTPPAHTVNHSQADARPSFSPSYSSSIPQPARSSGGFEDDDPLLTVGMACASDPAVQAGAAKLQTIMTTIIGALSTLTTGWWGRFGERHGRTRVLAISSLGLFFTDLIFILVSTLRNPLATHAHKFLILAPVIEGFLGGWSTLTGANTAYIADCTSPDTRATIFARFTGLMFAGLALGPIIGAWLIRNPIPFLSLGSDYQPSQRVNSVFWVSMCGTFINLLFVLFVFPESLCTSRHAISRKGKNRAVDNDEVGISNEDQRGWVITRAVRSFISPLAQFSPTNVPIIRSTGMLSHPCVYEDWSLTFLALSLFVHTISSGLFQLKYLYAEYIYGWATEQLSYYISFVGAVRASYLLILLPLILVTFRPAQAVVSSSPIPAQPKANGSTAKPKPKKSHLLSQIRFDLLVIQYSMLMDFCSHALVVLFPLPYDDPGSAWWSQLAFVGATSLSCAGAGVIPAAQSLALCTLQGRKIAEEEVTRLRGMERAPVIQDTAIEAGILFGAMAAIQAIGSTIVGPILLCILYSNTVASFPRAIFVAAAVLVTVGLALVGFVRPEDSLTMLKHPRKMRKPASTPRDIAEERRGRSRVSKDLRGGAASYGSYGAIANGTSTADRAKMEVGTA